MRRPTTINTSAPTNRRPWIIYSNREEGKYCTNADRWWRLQVEVETQKTHLVKHGQQQEQVKMRIKRNYRSGCHTCSSWTFYKNQKRQMKNHDGHHRCLLTHAWLKIRERLLQDPGIIVQQRRKYKWKEENYDGFLWGKCDSTVSPLLW